MGNDFFVQLFMVLYLNLFIFIFVGSRFKKECRNKVLILEVDRGILSAAKNAKLGRSTECFFKFILSWLDSILH